MIAGIDEVGRGAWAGPLVVGAVVLGSEIKGLTDSKLLTKKRRELLYDQIYESAAGIGLGWVDATEIDAIGLSASLKLATKRAVAELQQSSATFHEIIIDGTVNFLAGTTLESHVTTLKKADLLIPSVSAASIVAKVTRDRYMAEQDGIEEGYGFSSHVGYGTAAHRRAIEARGVSPLHRLSIAPLKKYSLKPAAHAVRVSSAQSSRQIGDASEDVASMHLRSKGYDIVVRNWKTKFCEIDIVARSGTTYWFFEVKHRKTAEQGGGIAAVTPQKLKQMSRAAEAYALYHQTTADLRLGVISTSGEPPVVTDFLLLD